MLIYLCSYVNPNVYQVKIALPKHLPPQRSIIIKGVPNLLNGEDVKEILTKKYQSIYSVDDILGTNNGKSRYIRIDLLNSTEYNQLLNSGVIKSANSRLNDVKDVVKTNKTGNIRNVTLNVTIATMTTSQLIMHAPLSRVTDVISYNIYNNIPKFYP